MSDSDPSITDLMSRTRSLLPTLESTLTSFTHSNSDFRIVHTINPTSTPPPPPKTLYILDSSFNPPSKAHLSLATSALKNATASPAAPQPHRLLFLFSTHHADKAPSPASFPHRLALMTLLAEDLHREATAPTTATTTNQQSNVTAALASIPIDIGLTKAPFYTDKSAAISSADPSPYPSNPTHIHLMGFDTLTRFLAPKYYKASSPPLSALVPFFNAGHRLLVTERPNSSSANTTPADSVEAQRQYVADLAAGTLESEGFERAWAAQVELVPGDEEVEGVSSTRVRRVAHEGRWEEVRELCTPGVAEWVREWGLYEGDARGAKMA